MLHFDSDYMRGCHPEILARLTETNLEQTPGYGTDPYTRQAREALLAACGLTPETGRVAFLVGGTQTNATMIDLLTPPYEGVIAADTSHINVHEAGAVEATGHKILTLPAHDGRLAAADIEAYLENFYADETWDHMVRPGLVYISFPTELGTLYSLSDLEAIAAVCRRRGVPLFVDGARLAYGLAAEGNDVGLADLARLADAFYVGGTKCGAMFGEAVVSRRPELFGAITAFVKAHGALLAKGRLLGLQFLTLMEGDLYRRAGRNGIDMAMRLKRGLLAQGHELYIDSPTNQQFFVLPNELIDRLKSAATFELWGPRGATHTPVRFVTDWATTPADVDALLARL